MDAQQLKLDYFQIYDVVNRDQPISIQLQGQFDRRRLKMDLRRLDLFANPVSKNGEPFYDKQAHLTWYWGGQPAEPMRVVKLENQFGAFEIRTGAGHGLLVPTQKAEPGSTFPERLDHYKVYQVLDIDKTPQDKVKLRDQFGGAEVKLGAALYFAVPVKKWHEDQTFGIQNERAHLLILRITPRNVEKAIKVRNQFTRSALTVQRSVMLAVPSIKHGWKLV